MHLPFLHLWDHVALASMQAICRLSADNRGGFSSRPNKDAGWPHVVDCTVTVAVARVGAMTSGFKKVKTSIPNRDSENQDADI